MPDISIHAREQQKQIGFPSAIDMKERRKPDGDVR
jgi:hypothetical protein